MKKLCESLGLLAVVAAVLFGAVRTEAATITYTKSGIGSGTRGSTSFTDALITVTGSGDTNNVTDGLPFFNGYTNGANPLTLTVYGLGHSHHQLSRLHD